MNTQLKRLAGALSFLIFGMIYPLLSTELPKEIVSIMDQPRYKHATWGILVKDTQTNKILYSLAPDKMFLPASVTKLFTMAALLNVLGEDYQIETPVYAQGSVTKQGQLKGNLILVAKADLFMGGRINQKGNISFTNLDHTDSNIIPGATLTLEDPLNGLKNLAEQVRQKGIKSIDGDVRIDDRLFAKLHVQDTDLFPLIINDNVIDFEVTPTTIGHTAELMWRPQVPGYKVVNQVKTVKAGKPSEVKVTADPSGKQFVLSGEIATDTKHLVQNYTIASPSEFGRLAFIQALEEVGVKVNIQKPKGIPLISQKEYATMQPVALLKSPLLSDYVKLTLKVSLNLGANLSPMLISSAHGQPNFDKGMEEIGKFLTETVGIHNDEFAFQDAQGGPNNRVTPSAVIKLLDYMRTLSPEKFKTYYHALPILGVDGSLEGVQRQSPARGHVHAKTGTEVSENLVNKPNKLFLIGKALAGYIEAKNGHLLEFVIMIDNTHLDNINDLFTSFEDLGKIASILYDPSSEKEE